MNALAKFPSEAGFDVDALVLARRDDVDMGDGGDGAGVANRRGR